MRSNANGSLIRMGVIGYGYWGPNVVRNFEATEGIQVVSVCDMNPDMLQKAKKTHSGIEVTSDADSLVTAPNIDAVAIVTPVTTHFGIAKRALKNGKHVFVEKPFTQTSAQAEELIKLAEGKKLTIMVDHTFLFTGAVRKIKELIDMGTLGRLYYFDSARVNLGLFQHDVNVIWDLAPHDFSIMDYLISATPVAMVATGVSHFNGIEDIAYVTVYFPEKMIAHFSVNWLSPVKVRTTLIGGDKRMLVWNDLDSDEKVKIYDKGVEVTSQESIYDLLVSYRSGDMWVPKIDQNEALKLEAEYFVDCVSHGKAPLNDGKAGLRIVKMLEAANKSLKNQGEIVQL
jgi:predicted dehydrogenase